jgi:hypothetical protein
MIKYILKCENKHEFESWFSDSKEFEKLKKNKILECIFCSTTKVEKAIMAPRVIGSKKIKKNKMFPQKEFLKVKKELVKIKKFVEKNFEFVGNKFPDEARDIFYDNKKKRNIYGTTSSKEQKELQEEGIDLTTIPWIDEKEN